MNEMFEHQRLESSTSKLVEQSRWTWMNEEMNAEGAQRGEGKWFQNTQTTRNKTTPLT